MNAEVAEIAPRLPDGLTPLQIVQLEILREPNPELFKARMEIWREFKAMQAESAYVTAFAEFKKNAPAVYKDLHNDQFGSDYSSLPNLVNTVNPALGAYGLNARWDIVQGEAIEVICILSHIDGHKERVKLIGLPDTTGKKNDLQQLKSALTYLEGATFQAITGIVAQDPDANDDGNGSGSVTTGGAPTANSGPQQPEGYTPWAEGLKVKAEEGKDSLLKAWKESSMERRTYMANHQSHIWAALKRQAEKISAKATGAASPAQESAS